MNWHFWGRKLFYHITVPIPRQNGIHWICPYGGSRKHLFQIENNWSVDWLGWLMGRSGYQTY